jgi:hypothetical protein
MKWKSGSRLATLIAIRPAFRSARLRAYLTALRPAFRPKLAIPIPSAVVVAAHIMVEAVAVAVHIMVAAVIVVPDNSFAQFIRMKIYTIFKSAGISKNSHVPWLFLYLSYSGGLLAMRCKA